MTASITQKKYVWQALVVPFLVAWLAWMAVGLAGWLDHEVLERLVGIFSTGKIELPELQAGDRAILETTIQAVLLLLFATAATWSGFRLSAVPRVLVLVQLFV